MITSLVGTQGAIVAVYFATIVAVGWCLRSRVRGGRDFFAGGRAVPWWMSGISLYMGNFSAWLFTGGAALIWSTTGFGLLYFFLVNTCAYALGSQLTAARWRRARVLSPVELTRERFGVATQLLMTPIYVVMYYAASGLQLLGLAVVAHGILDVPIPAAIVGIGVVMLAYTVAAGVWTVVVTDVFQCVVLLSITAVVAPLAVDLLPNGLADVVAVVDLEIPWVDAVHGYDVHYLLAGFVSFTIGVASGQAPRFYCVPDERDASRAGLLAGALYLTTPLLFAIPALVARAHWGGADELAALGWGERPNEQVWLRVVEATLTPALAGVFLAAMFAATMSALDSVNNMVAAMLSRDLWLHVRPDASDRDQLRVGRVATAFGTVVVVGLALVYHGNRSGLFDSMMRIFFLTAPPLHVPIVLGLLVRSAPRGAGLVTAVVGIVLGVATSDLLPFGLAWSRGPQVYVTVLACASVFVTARRLRGAWLANQRPKAWTIVGALGAGVGVAIEIGGESVTTAAAFGFGFGALVVAFVPWLCRSADGASLEDLWSRLDTPVDRAREVTGSAADASRLHRLVARLTFGFAIAVVLLGAGELVLRETDEPASILPFVGVGAAAAALGTVLWWLSRAESGRREES